MSSLTQQAALTAGTSIVSYLLLRAFEQSSPMQKVAVVTFLAGCRALAALVFDQKPPLNFNRKIFIQSAIYLVSMGIAFYFCKYKLSFNSSDYFHHIGIYAVSTLITTLIVSLASSMTETPNASQATKKK